MTNDSALASLKGKKILWVEDDKFLQNIISHKLNSTETQVLYARDGQAALNMAISEKPDLIVLDVLLPNIDGIEVLRKLKENANTEFIPVIIFSNVDDKSRIEESQRLGSAGFFVKTSMTMDEIIAELDKVLSRQ